MLGYSSMYKSYLNPPSVILDHQRKWWPEDGDGTDSFFTALRSSSMVSPFLLTRRISEGEVAERLSKAGATISGVWVPNCAVSGAAPHIDLLSMLGSAPLSNRCPHIYFVSRVDQLYDNKLWVDVCRAANLVIIDSQWKAYSGSNVMSVRKNDVFEQASHKLSALTKVIRSYCSNMSADTNVTSATIYDASRNFDMRDVLAAVESAGIFNGTVKNVNYLSGSCGQFNMRLTFGYAYIWGAGLNIILVDRFSSIVPTEIVEGAKILFVDKDFRVRGIEHIRAPYKDWPQQMQIYDNLIDDVPLAMSTVGNLLLTATELCNCSTGASSLNAEMRATIIKSIYNAGLIVDTVMRQSSNHLGDFSPKSIRLAVLELGLEEIASDFGVFPGDILDGDARPQKDIPYDVLLYVYTFTQELCKRNYAAFCPWISRVSLPTQCW